MKAKFLDIFMNILGVALFLLLVVVSYVKVKDFCAPEFEVVDYAERIPYEYTDDEGIRRTSEYRVAWYHENFGKAYVAAYDPSTGKYAAFKDDYAIELKKVIPPSKYSFIHRCFWGIFILLVAASAALIYFVGRYLRDILLYLFIRVVPSFTNCSYFLFTADKRTCCVKSVEKLIPRSIHRYIRKEEKRLYKKYTAEFAGLVINMLRQIALQESTKIKFRLIYNEDLVLQHVYLAGLLNYWKGKIGQDKNAASNVEYLIRLQSYTYIPVGKIGFTAQSFEHEVSVQLKKLFAEVIGCEIFNFVADTSSRAQTNEAGCLYINIKVANSSKCFTWSGNEIPTGTYIPGLEVMFEIFHYVGGEPKVLWRRYLSPECDYTAQKGCYNEKAMYRNMVAKTISLFYDTLKK